MPGSSAVALLLFVLALSPPFPQSGAATHEVAGVQIVGAHRYAPADISKLSGLSVGAPISVGDLKPIAERLAASGLFKNLSYRYVTAGRKMTVVFEIEEADWTIPVTFDNFVWFTDEALVKWVRADVPSFDGTAPPSEGTPDLIVRSLQGLLKSRDLPGQVSFSPRTSLKGGEMRYLFSVRDPAPKLCALRVSGASVIPERELTSAPGIDVGGGYSRFSLTGISNGTLRDMYHRKGHWQAAFAPPSVALDPACGGVIATLQVEEGPQFTWDRAEWNGRAALAAPDLDAALGMKAGEVADASRIDAGMVRVHALYRKHGYMLAEANYSPRLDGAARRAVFEMRVEEGPQFRMGTLEFGGVSPADAATLTKKWRLAPGSVYDDTYPLAFYRDVLSGLRGPSGAPATIDTQLDSDRHVVNLRFILK